MARTREKTSGGTGKIGERKEREGRKRSSGQGGVGPGHYEEGEGMGR